MLSLIARETLRNKRKRHAKQMKDTRRDLFAISHSLFAFCMKSQKEMQTRNQLVLLMQRI